MNLTYIVQNPSDTTVGVRATVNDKEMTVTAAGFECELVSENGMNGTIKLRFIGDQVEGAKQMFTQDSKINVNFAQ